MCVARIVSLPSVGGSGGGGSGGDGAASAGSSEDGTGTVGGGSLGRELEGYGGSGESVAGETFWRMAKRRCRRWCNGEWLICFLSLGRLLYSFVEHS